VFQGSGIGRACAIGFAKDGAASILITDLNLDTAKSVAAECKTVATAVNFRVETLHIDITQEESVEMATKYMVETFGRIDYCVNCAGVSSVEA
jgi:NAD(P)-dependent dehydrogenase (short-subunit alcohol dehydrogenase family)